MALEDLISSIYQQNTQIPLQYGQLSNQSFSPYYTYLGNQAQTQANLGNSLVGQMGSIGTSGMGLYGNLTGQETAMYQSELPLRMEMAKYNSLAPVLSGLLGQFGGGGGMSISPISMGFDRPDVMRGYNDAVTNAQSAVRGAYGQAASAARSYDDEFRQAFTDNLDRLPSLPGTRAKQPAALPTGNAGYQFPPPVQAPGAKPPLARGPMAAPAGGMPAGKAPPVSPPRYHF